jgi:hypothetical protein
VIVRLMGEGQYQAGEELKARLAELDDDAVAALERDDEESLDRALEAMWNLVRAEGTPLPDAELATSDVVIPPSDLTLEETRELFAEDGLIPDIVA